VLRCALYVFCLLVILIKLLVLAKWLAEKTALRKPICDKEIIPTKPRLKSAYNFLFIVLFHCFIVFLFCFPAPYISYHTPIAWYSPFVLKVPLNTNQPTGCTSAGGLCLILLGSVVFNCSCNLNDFLLQYW